MIRKNIPKFQKRRKEKWTPPNGLAIQLQESRDHFEEQVGSERTIGFKGVVNLVTEMDILSEKIIVDEIEERFPDHAILAEERPAMEKASRSVGLSTPSTAPRITLMASPFFPSP